MIKVIDLKKSFGNLNVLKKINVEIKKGDIAAVLGPSGSGKSTFLRSLIDLEAIDGGSIIIEGEYLCKSGKRGIFKDNILLKIPFYVLSHCLSPVF